jgi:DNA polymerase sigma
MRLALLARLQRIVSDKWPRADPKLHIFGSSANDMCLASGDIDLCLIINEDAAGPESLLVKQLGQLLERNNMKNVSPLPRARVPIVKFRDPMSRLSCDICINNPLAIHNTRLVADYSRIDPRVRILSYLVKYWAKKRQVNNPYEGTLSSYAYINLVIFYLQTRNPPVLPCLQSMADDYTDRLIVDKYDCTYFSDIDSLVGFGTQNVDSVAELLYGFFRFYAYDYDYIEKVVCIRKASALAKSDKGWSKSQFRENNWICIEDPFEVTHNLGRVCDKESLNFIRSEFRRASKVLTQSGSFRFVCDPEIIKNK